MQTFSPRASPPTLPRLHPQLKVGRQEAGLCPDSFQTRMGEMLLPEMKNPPQPSPEMINEASRGRLIGWFRQGRIFKASELVGSVSAYSAKISLDDTWDYQTRHLSAFLSLDEGEKSLRTLYYLSLCDGELPSFHFWTKSNELDWITSETTNEQLRHPKPTGEVDVPKDDNKASNSNQKLEKVGPQAIERTSSALVDKQSRPAALNLPGREAASSRIVDISPETIAPVAQGVNQPEARRMPAFSSDTQVPTAQTSDLGVEGSSQKMSQGTSTLQYSNVRSKPSMDLTREPSTLLRCEKGARLLDDYSKTEFKSMAYHLAKFEEDDDEVGSGLLFVDILKSGESKSEAIAIKSGIPFDRTYARQIQPFLGMKGCQFRIRSDAYTEKTPWDHGKDGTLKITRNGAGYAYLNASGAWNNLSQRRSNNKTLETAIEFLWESEDKPNNLQLRLPPDYDEPMDIDRSAKSLISNELGELLQHISGSSTSSGALEQIPFQYAAEIFIHEKDAAFVHPLVQNLKSAQLESIPEEEEPVLEHEEPKDQRRGTLVPSIVGFDTNLALDASTRRPKVRTQSEIADLERRVQIAETQAEQFGRLVVERDAQLSRLAEKAGRTENTLQELIQTCFKWRSDHNVLQKRVEDLEAQIKASTQEQNGSQGTGGGLTSISLDDAAPPQGPESNIKGKEPEEAKVLDDRWGLVTSAQNNAAATQGPATGVQDKTLLYCKVCVKSVDKLNESMRRKHAEKCGTDTASFTRLTLMQAKSLRAERAAGKVGQVQKRKRSTEDEPEEGSESSTKRPKRAVKPAGIPEAKKVPVVKEAAARSSRTRGKTPAPQAAHQATTDSEAEEAPTTTETNTQVTRARSKTPAARVATAEDTPDGDNVAPKGRSNLKRSSDGDDAGSSLRKRTKR